MYTVAGQFLDVHVWKLYWTKILICELFASHLIYSYPETYVHFPSCSGIFVHPSVDYQALSFLILLSLFLPWQAGDSTGPTALPLRCCCQCSLHWLHLLIFRSLFTFFPLPGGLSLFAREQLPLLNFGDSALFGQLWISHQHLVPGMFNIATSSLFQWLLCSFQATLCTLVSHLCLHPSPIRTPGALRQFVYCGSCSFTQPVLTKHLLCARLWLKS